MVLKAHPYRQREQVGKALVSRGLRAICRWRTRPERWRHATSCGWWSTPRCSQKPSPPDRRAVVPSGVGEAGRAGQPQRIGKGEARAPYEFGCKVSIATPATKPRGGQFVLHAKALHGNPCDSHTLGPVVTELEQLTGVETRRIHVDGKSSIRRKGTGNKGSPASDRTAPRPKGVHVLENEQPGHQPRRQWRPALARYSHAGKALIEKPPIDLARQPCRRMAEVHDVF